MLSALTLKDNGVPKYVQLRSKLPLRCVAGCYRQVRGFRSMRQVAVELSIELNTVQRAYTDLEREGILSMVQGRGTFVSETAPPARSVAPTGICRNRLRSGSIARHRARRVDLSP